MRFRFGDHVVDAARRELHRGPDAVPVEPQVFDLLLYLIQNRDRVVTRDDMLAAVWHGRIVSEATLSSRINAVRRAVGDSGEQQQVIRTVVRRGVRFVGEVKEDATDRPAEPAPLPATPHQQVTFCKSIDGVHLAVAETGNGPVLVKAANWLNHLEHDWRSPMWSPLFVRLSAQYRLVRYDERGTGLSDWDVRDISFESFVEDLEAVVDSLSLERFTLLGVSQGAAVSIAYATRHPHRVSRLVLLGGYPLGWNRRGSAEEIATREAMLTLVQHGWGSDNPAFRQVFTSRFFPDATIEQMHAFNELQRVSASPENAVRIIRAFGDIDVVDMLPRITTPTLILHARHDALVPLEQGLRLAREIPNARFVTLDSRNHLAFSHEPAWQHLVDELHDFLGQTDQGGSRKSGTVSIGPK